MQNLLTFTYWFASLPMPFIRPAFIGLLVLFAAFVVAGVLLHLVAKQKHDDLYWREGFAYLAANLFQTGLIGLILVWCAQQQVGFFGMRFWFLILAVVFIIRAALVAKRMMKDLPTKAAAYAEQARIRKYLP